MIGYDIISLTERKFGDLCTGWLVAAPAIATEERIRQAVAVEGAVNPRGLMANPNEAYDDPIEMGARVVAFSALTGRALPRRVHELISEAADLRGAWRGFSGSGQPGNGRPSNRRLGD